MADAAATLERCEPALGAVRVLGEGAGLVAQVGRGRLPIPWAGVDARFVGGTTGWKLRAARFELAAGARRRGTWPPVGTVNSRRRLAAVDSAAGTLLHVRPEVSPPTVPGRVDQTCDRRAHPKTRRPAAVAAGRASRQGGCR